MADEDGLSPKQFGASFKGFLESMASAEPKQEPFFLKLIREHFGTDPSLLPAVAERLSMNEHPNVQVALDAVLARPGTTSELIGVRAGNPYDGLTLSGLTASGGGSLHSLSTRGPVAYANVTLHDETVLPCVESGIWLVKKDGVPLVVLVCGANRIAVRESLTLEVMAAERPAADAFLGELRRAMGQLSVYRGRVVSLVSGDGSRGNRIRFHRLPEVSRDDIILPSGLLEKIERDSLSFVRHTERLRAAGRHLRRGLLLHGPPGTGKTLTAMYLASQLTGHTIVLLTGRSLGLIEQSCRIARLLEPSVVVIEDVDLVAQDRERAGSSSPLLFELLNQMDGLSEDARVLFLLTTNRPEVLEPALAARPGRIDQVLEVPLPDADCRRRLFDLYGKGLKLEVTRMDSVIKRTEKASGAFIRELLRKAAVLAAEAGPAVSPERDPIVPKLIVRDEHLEQALGEIVSEAGGLARAFLGFRLD